MGDLDITFRRLLRGLPGPILQLAFPRRGLVPIGSPVDPSLDRARPRTADNLFRVRDGNAEAVVHVEFERDWRSEMPRRLFEYASAAVVATGLPVWSVVVLLKPGGRPPRGIGVYRIPGVGGDAFVFCYRVVSLWQLDARQLRADLGLTGAPFCVAMQGADEEFVRSLAQEVHVGRGLTKRDRNTTMKLLYYVAAAILGSEAAKRIFHMESIIQDPNVQELIREWQDQGHAKGHAQGHAKGHAQGHAKGRAEEARLLLYKVLAVRSLPMTPEARARIDGEPEVARLEAWLEAAVLAGTIGDVFGPRMRKPQRRTRRRRSPRRA